MATPYYTYIILLILSFVQSEVQSGYSKCAYSVIDQKLLAHACRQPGYVRQVCAATSYSSIMVSYHELLFELLLIDMHQNCTRTGYEIHACIASSPYLSIIISSRNEKFVS